MRNITLLSTGQVQIPQAMRMSRNWTEGTLLDLEEYPQGLLLKPIESAVFPPATLDALMGITGYSGPALTNVEIQAALDKDLSSKTGFL